MLHPPKKYSPNLPLLQNISTLPEYVIAVQKAAYNNAKFSYSIC